MRPIYFLLLLVHTFALGQKTKTSIKLEITGSSDLETKTIKKLPHPTSFTEKEALLKTIDELTNNLIIIGHYDIKHKFDKKNDSLYKVKFSLGTKYNLLKLYIPQHKLLQTYIAELGFTTKADTIEIETASAKAYLTQLTKIASNNGDPFTKFQITDISKTSTTTLIGNLTISTTQQRKISRILIKGYDQISKGYFKNSVKRLINTTYNQKEIIQKSKEISSLPFINESKSPDVLFSQDSTTVFFYLTKQNTNRFDGFLGFSNNENDDLLRLDGYLDLELTNNLNYGESLTLNYKSDGDDQSQLHIQTRLPYLFQTPIGIEASLSIFRKDTTFSTTQQDANLFYQTNTKHSTSIGYTISKSNNLQESELTEQLTSVESYNTSSFQINHDFILRQENFFFPIKTRIKGKAGLNNRTVASQTTKQESLFLEASNIFELNKKNSIFLKSTSQYLISPNYILNELFRLGGITSIRGFEENSIFANLSTILNTEYRYQLNNSIYINTVLDLAYVENEVQEEKNTLFGAGIGAGIRTKAGVLKINLANGKFQNQVFSFSNTKLHLILAVRF